MHFGYKNEIALEGTVLEGLEGEGTEVDNSLPASVRRLVENRSSLTDGPKLTELIIPRLRGPALELV